jgi:hypothetical protein
VASTTLVAQQELGLHFNQAVWQANNTNPALIPNYKVVIALPSVYSDFSLDNRGITYEDLIARNTATGKITLNTDNIINKWEASNAIRNATQFDAFSVGFRVKKAFVSFGLSGAINTHLGLSKDLLDIGFNGNAKFIGKTANLGLDIESYAVGQKYLGVAYNINSKLTVATRLKALSGGYAISAENPNMTLTTSDDIYQLTLTSKYRLNTAGIGDYKGYTIGDTMQRFTSYLNFADQAQVNQSAKNAFLSGPNKGFALDLGATYQVNEKLSVAISATDIGGKVTWKEQVSTFGHNGFEFKGLDFGVILRGDSTSFDKVMDTLVKSFDLSKTTHDAFTTKLPTRTYLSVSYRMNKVIQLGGLFFTESYRGKLNPAFALGLNTNTGWLNIGLSWAYRNKSASNIGMSATAKMGPIQIFAVTDNIIPVFNLKSSNINFNGRFGINLLFGKPKKVEEVKVPVIETAPTPPPATEAIKN